MAIVKHKLKDIDTKLTKKEIKLAKKANTKPIVFDEDSPYLSEDELKEFKRLNANNRKKKLVSLRVSSSTVDLAKNYCEEGYTSMLSRLLDLAIKDKEMVKRCL